jgi:hypothetical protein
LEGQKDLEFLHRHISNLLREVTAMIKNWKKYSIILTVLLVYAFLPFKESYAAPTVKLVISPNDTNICPSASSIALTAKASGTELTFEWRLLGVGTFKGRTTGSAIFYVPPEKIGQQEEQAIVSVKVTDKNGEVATDSIVFVISKKEILPTPTAEKEQLQPTDKEQAKGEHTQNRDCTSITANGYDVTFSPQELVGVYKDWREWPWVQFALKYARQEKASEVLAYEVRKKEGYYDIWRFEVDGTTLNYRYLSGAPVIKTGSCWKQFEGKIPNSILALGVSKLVIYVLKSE